MWIAVVLLCVSPADVKTCDVLVRTDQGFFSKSAFLTTGSPLLVTLGTAL